jgi:CRP-like cAMP-binding protein
MRVLTALATRAPARNVPWCDRCALRSGCGFEDFSEEELSFMMNFKLGHGRAWAGEIIVDETVQKPHCYTLFSGWAVRSRLLAGGQRNVLSILLPGDPMGLESALCGTSADVFEAVTDVTFCVFDTARLRAMLNTPGFGNRIVRLLAWENVRMANRLAATAACNARDNLTDLIFDLYLRLERRRMTQGYTFKLPLSQKQLAEVVGLTPVHLHRVLRGLQKDGIFEIEHRTVTIRNFQELVSSCSGRATSVLDVPLL